MIEPRAGLTERAQAWAFEQVGEHDAAVGHVAAQLGVAWWTVMDQVKHRGQPVIDDSDRLTDTTAVGVDETAFVRATGQHPTLFATGIADLTPGRPARLLDVVVGRSGTVLAAWLSDQPTQCRQRVATASLGPFRVRHRPGRSAAGRDPGPRPLPRRQARPVLRR